MKATCEDRDVICDEWPDVAMVSISSKTQMQKKSQFEARVMG